MKKYAALIFAFLLLAGIFPAFAAEKTTNVYAFTEQGCPFCAKTLTLLEELKSKDYPELNVHVYDLKTNPEYFSKFTEFAKAYGADISKVPTTFINKIAISGFRESDLRQMVEYCHLPVNTCLDPAKFVQEKLSQPTPPNESQPITSTARPEVIGWIIIGGLIVGGAIFIFNKLL